jgi:biopolymer transport protein ExbD
MLTVSVVVQKDAILVDGKEVANVQSETNPNVPNARSYFVDGSDKTGLSINKLFDELNDKKEVSKVLESKTKGQIKFDGKMVLQFDQNIPYSLIREVMFTAGKAEFFDFQFVLSQK